METERLHLRELTLEDTEAVFRHFSDPLVVEFMDIGVCKNREEAAEIISFHIRDSGCRYGMFLKETGELVGTCGFHCWGQSQGKSKAEVGFDVASSHWRKGYMLEAAMPIIQLGFEQMKLDYIEATTEPGNRPSQQLLNKLGFIQSEELVDQLVYFTLTKEGVSNFKYIE